MVLGRAKAEEAQVCYIKAVIENLTRIKEKQPDRGLICISSNAPLDQYLGKNVGRRGK